jgi:hypothetical protein
MAFILIPQHGEKVYINAWNWRPTLEILRTEHLVDDETLELLGCNLGTTVDERLALLIAEALTRRLAGMCPGDRVRADLSITAAPKRPVVFSPGMSTDEIDPVDLYSAHYEWLINFRDFCERSGGFVVC